MRRALLCSRLGSNMLGLCFDQPAYSVVLQFMSTSHSHQHTFHPSNLHLTQWPKPQHPILAQPTAHRKRPITISPSSPHNAKPLPNPHHANQPTSPPRPRRERKHRKSLNGAYETRRYIPPRSPFTCHKQTTAFRLTTSEPPGFYNDTRLTATASRRLAFPLPMTEDEERLEKLWRPHLVERGISDWDTELYIADVRNFERWFRAHRRKGREGWEWEWERPSLAVRIHVLNEGNSWGESVRMARRVLRDEPWL